MLCDGGGDSGVEVKWFGEENVTETVLDSLLGVVFLQHNGTQTKFSLLSSTLVPA